MSDNQTTTPIASTTTPAPAAPAETKAIAVRPPPTPIRFSAGVGADVQTWEDAQRVANVFAQSRYFKDVNETAQALVKITMGSELGFTPMASMLGIYIIEGRPAMSSAMINAVIRRSNRYRFEVVRWDEEACSLMWREKVDGEWLALGPSSFTIADAQRANLTGKGVWKAYPKAMLWARALTQGARAYTPDLFFGAPVYTPDELGDNVVELPDGTQVIEAPSKQQAAPAQRGVAGVTAALAVGAVESNAAEERAARKSKAKATAVVTPDGRPVNVVEPAPKVTTDSPDHPTPAAPPPAPSSSSETTTAPASPPSSPPSTPTDDGDESEPEVDDDPEAAIAAATEPSPGRVRTGLPAELEALLLRRQQRPADVAFAEAVLELSKPGLDSKAMTTIVVAASPKVTTEQKAALRVMTRALFNRLKGLDVMTNIETPADKAALKLALAIEGNAVTDMLATG